ncbi:MAG TPA: aldehyde dehydrogenase family protein [Terriglobia bacterium]|nr:aldehyde dehydrogenase family protein [Terriglobia bacterium]
MTSEVTAARMAPLETQPGIVPDTVSPAAITDGPSSENGISQRPALPLAGPRKIQSLNPATADLLAEFDAAEPEEVEAAVAEARGAAPVWRSLGAAGRARHLVRLREALFDRRHDLAALITRETGKPRLEALLTEVMVTLDALDFLARHGPAFLAPESVPHQNLAVRFKRGRLEYEPYGVVGIISPFNYPFSIPMHQIAAALVAGNTVVLKPSEFTPQAGLAIQQIADDAGLPAGVLNVVVGDGVTGSALVNAAIDKLVFTGSVATGKGIQVEAARRLLPTVLELGGKDPVIVCADADLDLASSGTVWGAFTNAGQACLSAERVYVVENVADRFIELCEEKTKRLRVGAGEDPDTEVGPLIRERQLKVVEELVAEAVAAGATVLSGGRRTSPAGLAGFFYEPTVLTNVHHGMRIMREETFGPVLPIMTVRDEAEAVRLANDSEFGLSASIWTRDLQGGERLARSLECGSVMVNDCLSSFGIAEAPHGGFKLSGPGRTHSRLGVMEMARVKYIDVDLVPRLPKLWWFSYDSRASRLMESFVDFLFAPGFWSRMRGALGLLSRAPGRIRSMRGPHH